MQSSRDPIVVAGAAVADAAVVSCRDHDAFLSCGRKRSWFEEALTSTSTPTVVDVATSQSRGGAMKVERLRILQRQGLRERGRGISF